MIYLICLLSEMCLDRSQTHAPDVYVSGLNRTDQTHHIGLGMKADTSGLCSHPIHHQHPLRN